MKNTKTYKTVTHGSDSYTIPFNITCTVSGLTKVYTSEEYINKKLDRFGGLEKLNQTYICRDALKLRKAGKSDEEIKQILSKPTTKDQPIPENTPVTVNEQPTEAVVEKPIAKQDSKGKYRNEKGHLIAKDKLDQYTLVPFVKAA